MSQPGRHPPLGDPSKGLRAGFSVDLASAGPRLLLGLRR